MGLKEREGKERQRQKEREKERDRQTQGNIEVHRDSQGRIITTRERATGKEELTSEESEASRRESISFSSSYS